MTSVFRSTVATSLLALAPCGCFGDGPEGLKGEDHPIVDQGIEAQKNLASIVASEPELTVLIGSLDLADDGCLVSGPRAVDRCSWYNPILRVNGDIGWSLTARPLDPSLPMLAAIPRDEVAAGEAPIDAAVRSVGWARNVPTIFLAVRVSVDSMTSYFSQRSGWSDDPPTISCGDFPVTEAYFVGPFARLDALGHSEEEMADGIDSATVDASAMVLDDGHGIVFGEAPLPTDCALHPE